MGSGVSKRKKKEKYGVDANETLRLPGEKKKKTKTKKNKDTSSKEDKVKSKSKSKDEKKKKSDKKEKKGKKKENDISIPVEIKVTTSPARPNVYDKECVTEEPEFDNYSLQAPNKSNRESEISESQYSCLYEDDDPNNSRPLYENDVDVERIEESVYVTPEEVPQLPPKIRLPSAAPRKPAQRPDETASERSSGDYENEHQSFIGQADQESGNSDTESDYVDTVPSSAVRKPPVIKPKPGPRPAGNDSQEIQVVVAIDFGTTFTGYAYSYVDDKHNIYMNPNWANGRGACFKAPTWVALDKNNELHAFGFEAQSTYHDDTESEDSTVNLYKEFKLQLMKKGSNDEVLVLKSEYGDDLPALKVFSAAIKFLKDKILQRFKDAGKVFRPWQICWVLTVPAIWDDAQKIFMKEAAREAGLIRNIEDKHLVIALEPEAASLYCRTLKMNNFKGGRGEGTVQLPKGTVYIVLDAGGGTIDITVHKVLGENKIAEIYQANGGPWGGSKINGRFETLLKGILGDDFVLHCQKENPGVWLDLILEFEQAKQSEAAKPDSEKSLILTLSLGLNNCFWEFKGETLKSVVEKHRGSGIRINKQDKLEVSPDNVRSMFSSVVGKTVDHMYSILKIPEISNASAIFIVGGFGQCPYLQEEIKKHFSDGRKREVLIPSEGNLCVVKGAVIFGHQPDFMTSRIARYTYAYLDKRIYNAKRDGERETVKMPNGDRLVLCLTPIIRKGEVVDYNEERSADFDVITEDFNLPIYCSESVEVDNPEAKDVTQMGELHINLPLIKRESQVGAANKVKVTFTLGTELKVKGTHLASKTTAETRLQMKSNKRK